MKFSGCIVSIYGITVAIGGLAGYLTADSLASLIAGSLCGAVLFASGLGIYRSSAVAYVTGLLISLVLALFFCVRFVQSYKFLPAGLMGIFSTLVFLLILSTKGRPHWKSKGPSSD